MVGLALVVFILIARCPVAITIRKLLEKIKGHYSRDRKLHSIPGATQGGPRNAGFCGLELLANLKLNSGTLRHREKKDTWPQLSAIESNQDSETKEPQCGEVVWLFTWSCGWRSVDRRQLATFEVDGITA